MEKIIFDVTEINEGTRFMSIPQYKMRLLDLFTSEEKAETILLASKDGVGFIADKYPDFEIKTIDLWKNIWCKLPLFGVFFRSFLYKKIVNSIDADAIFIASDLPGYARARVNKRKISVIHDIKTIKGGKIKKRIKRFVDLCISFNNADVLMAISKYTKSDVERFFPFVNKNKIKVIYNSVNVIPSSKKPSVELPVNYILWVNSIDINKNIMTFLKAVNELKDIKEEVVIVSKKFPYWYDVCLPYIKEHGLEKRIHVLSGISDEELRYLYEKAKLFITCSVREGFGYTPIEAAIYGCPVISTRCEALGDTTQNKLYYYNSPYDFKELASKINEVLNNYPTDKKLKDISEYFLAKYDRYKQKDEIFKLFEC